jgi:hypothetical protein
MAISFSPTEWDVERYRRFRGMSTELNSRMVKTIPKHVYDEVGDAIGVRHNGALLFDTEDVPGVLMDCCLHDWFENGENLVQRYAEAHPGKPGTDECFLLSAYTQAKYRVLLTEYSVPDAGVDCRDILNNEDLFLMDLALSRSLGSGAAARGMALATRTLPLGDYSMTTGAFLPIHSREAFKNMPRAEGGLFKGPGGIALSIVRACLAAGAADWVGYEPVATKKARTEPRMRFKRRRRPT